MGASDDDLFVKMDLRFAFKTATWFKKRELIAAAIDAIASLPVFAELRCAGPDDELKPFKGADAAKKLVAIGTDDNTSLKSSDEGTAEAMVRFMPLEGELSMKIWCGGAILRKHRDSILDQLASAATKIRAALAPASTGLLRGAAYPVHNRRGAFDYPRPRPPTEDPVHPNTPVIDLIDTRFHQTDHDEADADRARALAAAKPSAPARRSESDGLVVICWSKTAAEEDLKKGCTARDEWFAQAMSAGTKGGFDDQGDRQENTGPTQQKPPLTLYAPHSRIGYKAVVVFPDGRIEQHHWNQAKMVLKDKQLKDGTPVDAVKLIVPLRDLVFSIQDEAKAAGFAGVLYPGDNGTFWDPDPDGSWLSGPKGKDTAKTPKTPKRPVKSKAKPKAR